ncbi:MAG: transposase family protein [Pontiellaceae bacterium]|nr:transposase family protein [Pontiellaceae bacterium]MBN2785745.1 transposase family protein [Pontiellaceae bacterium]
MKVEKVPWAEGKSHTTKAFQLFLARRAHKLSWKETAESFCTSWDTVFRSVNGI